MNQAKPGDACRDACWQAARAAAEFGTQVAVVEDPRAALEQAVRSAGRDGLVVATGSMRLVGEFREVTPPSRLVYTWRWIEGVPDPRESLVTVEFRAHGARTEVVLVHDNFAGPGPVDMYDEGWRSGLDKLRGFLRPKEKINANRE